MATFEYSEEQIQELMSQIFNGEIDPRNLPEDLYKATGDFLKDGLFKGLGVSEANIQWGGTSNEFIEALRENVYMFSAAKTFHQTLEMSAALVNENGDLRNRKEFEVAMRDIYAKYNGGSNGEGEIKQGWLDVEYNTAIGQGQNAQAWQRIEKQKEIFPYLIYVAVDDEVLCDICGELNGICLPVDDAFWDENMPENHFGCRCLVEQVEKEEGEEKESSVEEVEEAIASANVPDEFKMNVGKTGEVFKAEGEGAHPYFTVPKEFDKFARENFGLNIPEAD